MNTKTKDPRTKLNNKYTISTIKSMKILAQSNDTFYNNKHKTQLHKINNTNIIDTSSNPKTKDTQNQITLTI